MKPHTTPPAVVAEPLDWGLSPIEALVLELEYTIDAPWFSDPRFPASNFSDHWLSVRGFSGDWLGRSCMGVATHPIREELQNLWQRQHGLKPCRPFSMAALANPEPDRGSQRKAASRRGDAGRRWPGGQCFDHVQFFAGADTGSPAAVLVEPYHFHPAPYEAVRAELEAAGLSFARHGTETGFYDPLRTSAMLVVRLDDAGHRCLNTPDLAAVLADQQMSAGILLVRAGLEHLHQTSGTERQERMRSVASTGQTVHPLRPRGGAG